MTPVAAHPGWAVPVATDIAFALAVLAVISSHLPAALRTFLLTLAVVDDLLAITIIAVFFTTDLQVTPLLLAALPLTVFTVLVQRRVRSWWLLLPLAVTVWTLVHASGLHATVAGVLLGFTVPVVRSQQVGGPDAGSGLAEHFEHRWRPVSAEWRCRCLRSSPPVSPWAASRSAHLAARPGRSRHCGRIGRG